MMTKHRGLRWTLFPAPAVTLGVGVSLPAAAPDHPWEGASLPPEQRATLLLEAMTLEEKIQQIGIYDDIDDPDHPDDQRRHRDPRRVLPEPLRHRHAVLDDGGRHLRPGAQLRVRRGAG